MKPAFLPALLALVLIACQSGTSTQGCSIHGPHELRPAHVERVRLGMTMAELEQAMGQPADYSPAEGIHYFSTGGDCPLDDEGARMASCGLVAEFRDGDEVTPTLRSCRWGAIGE